MSTPVTLLRSEMLARLPHVRHGFSGRDGGVSSGVFRSLNVALRIDDERSHVIENRQRILTSLGKPEASWVSLRQVHGDQVVEVTAFAGPNIEADGLWTRDPRAAIAVLSADCLPILIADKHGKAVAAVHAGWKGTVARIPAVAVARLDKAGVTPQDLTVALGPSIGPCCFEIQADVSDVIRQTFGPLADSALIVRDGRTYGDLWELNRAVLREAGVADASIDTLRVCTVCHAYMFSHRRDHGKTGRQAGIIALAPNS